MYSWILAAFLAKAQVFEDSVSVSAMLSRATFQKQKPRLSLAVLSLGLHWSWKAAVGWSPVQSQSGAHGDSPHLIVSLSLWPPESAFGSPYSDAVCPHWGHTPDLLGLSAVHTCCLAWVLGSSGYIVSHPFVIEHSFYIQKGSEPWFWCPESLMFCSLD